MFGFGYRPDHFTELSVHLVEKWHMRARYANAFVSAYRRDISALHECSAGNFQGSEMTVSSVLSVGGDVHPCDFSLVRQAYKAYMTDLRQGRHLGTDVELAVWAILAKRSNLVKTLNSAIGRFVEDNWELLFPDLFEVAFTEFPAGCPLSLYHSDARTGKAPGLSMMRPELGFVDMTVGPVQRSSSPQAFK
jgi:hypothetical protein